MLIPGEKRDSETDSTDLIICGSARVTEKKSRKTQIFGQQIVKKQRVSFGLYSRPWSTFC